MTQRKTVILWGQDDVLTEAMEIFLTAGEIEGWDVIRLPADDCISSLLEQVQKARPDLVILYQANADVDSDPLTKLIQERPELRVVVDQPESRVITVNLTSNVMQVYNKHSVTVRRIADLLSVIENRHFSENPVQEEV